MIVRSWELRSLICGSIGDAERHRGRYVAAFARLREGDARAPWVIDTFWSSLFQLKMRARTATSSRESRLKCATAALCNQQNRDRIQFVRYSSIHGNSVDGFFGSEARLRLYQRRFLRPRHHFSAFFELQFCFALNHSRFR